MQKAALITMAVLQFVLSTELYQLFKLPVFIAHYFEHKQQDNHLSLWEFVHIHYMQGDAKDADHKRDMQLPFKTHDCTELHLPIATPPLPITPIVPPVQTITVSYPLLNNLLVMPSHLADIWQPPRLAA